LRSKVLPGGISPPGESGEQLPHHADPVPAGARQLDEPGAHVCQGDQLPTARVVERLSDPILRGDGAEVDERPHHRRDRDPVDHRPVTGPEVLGLVDPARVVPCQAVGDPVTR